MSKSLGEVDDEIELPGVVSGAGGAAGGGEAKNKRREETVASDDEELEGVVETVSERLIGLTEMLPDPVWNVLRKGGVFSWWVARRTAWVAGSSIIILLSAIFVQQNRIDMEEMQSMQRKQMLLGPSSTSPIRM